MEEEEEEGMAESVEPNDKKKIGFRTNANCDYTQKASGRGTRRKK